MDADMHGRSGTGIPTLFALAILLAMSGALSGAIADSRQPDTVIIPGAVLLPTGELAEGKAVVIRDGRIHAVDDAAAHDDRGDAIRRPGTVLSPGLIDPYSVLGASGSNIERVHPIDPDLAVIDAIDLSDPAWGRALAEGITAAMIVPGANNVVGGMTAVMRTGNDRRLPEPLREHALMMFSFGSPALQSGRAPTSRSGAITMLRGAMTQARDGRGHERLAAVLDSSIDAIVRADAGEDVSAAIRFFETYGLGPAIVHSSDLLEVGDDVIEALVPMIVGPYSVGTPEHVLIAPGRLSRPGGLGGPGPGVELAFAGHTPVRDAASLRLSAALAVRAGLDPAAARRALTINPARILGVDDRIGAIDSGRDADMVLFTHDPLRPDARVLEVYLGGELVYVAADLHEEIARLDLDDDGDAEIGGSDDGSD
jgi:hypothetical protein